MIPYKATAVGVYNTTSSLFSTIACALCEKAKPYGAFAGAAVWYTYSEVDDPEGENIIVMAPYGECPMPTTHKDVPILF